jgi:single-strand DNA-binding protein
MNLVHIIGNLGRDPELRSTQGNQKVTNFSVATTERWRDRTTGDLREQTEWHNVVCWGRQAEVAAQFLRKGSQVSVLGKLRTRKWEDAATKATKYRTEIQCDRLELLGKRAAESHDEADTDVSLAADG